MIDALILRFRESTADGTIEAHSRMLSEAGHVWWGWWRKDSVSDQLRALGEVRAQAQKSGMILGLFDRSKRTFFKAIASDCAFSTGPIASPEPRTTPSYYSAEKVPAWFKFTHIEALDAEDGFIKLFNRPPTGEETFFLVIHGAPPTTKQPETIGLQSSIILHLSDIHFGADYGFPSTAGPCKFLFRKLLSAISGTKKLVLL